MRSTNGSPTESSRSCWTCGSRAWSWIGSKLYGEVETAAHQSATYPFAKERYWIDTPASRQGGGRGAAAATAVLHPLLHVNTSDLSGQRYRSTFTGEEFFLADDQLTTNGHAGHKVLPGVAYLEMARAAIDHALPARPGATVLELHDTVWAQPIVVCENTAVSLSLQANDSDQIDYDIYTQDGDQEIVHCQGRAVYSREPAPGLLNLEQLAGQTRAGKQVLAHLRLPSAVADTCGDYVLHPSVVGSALQAAVGLFEGQLAIDHLRLPSALDTLRILSPCRSEMVAWVRDARGGQAGEQVVKLDIDLCDERGNVCVQLHGLSLREPSQEIGTAAAPPPAIGSLLATPVWQARDEETPAGVRPTEYAEHHVVLCELSGVNAGQLASLLPHSQCLSLHGEPHQTIAQRYSEYGLACFERHRRCSPAQAAGQGARADCRR